MSIYSLHAAMPMIQEIFKKLKQNKFEDLKSMASGSGVDKSDSSEYVYFFMPGETNLESKFRLALMVGTGGKISFARYFLPSVYDGNLSSGSEEWTLAKHSKITYENRLSFIGCLQAIVGNFKLFSFFKSRKKK